MQYGVCSSFDLFRPVADAGFDYVELGVPTLLKPRESRAAFGETLAALRAGPLPCPVLNNFVPGDLDLKITGPDADLVALRAYVATVFERAEEAGVRVIVFGSSVARSVPDGFDRAEAFDQVVAFCRMVGPLAEARAVTVVVEPLSDCNFLRTVDEAADVVRATDHPAVRLLVDAYHWAVLGDSADAIVSNGPLLRHVHLATFANRLPPGAEPCDLGPFFDALRRAGYDGRVSVESSHTPTSDFARELALMKGAAAGRCVE